jgi:hypothetical protein
VETTPVLGLNGKTNDPSRGEFPNFVAKLELFGATAEKHHNKFQLVNIVSIFRGKLIGQ